MTTIVTQENLVQQLRSPMLTEGLSVVSGCNYVAVDITDSRPWPNDVDLPTCPIIGVGGSHDACDVCVTNDQLDEVVAAIDRQPVAASALAEVLRHNEHANITDGLLVESLTYSTLQQSDGFRAWLAARSPHAHHTSTEPVLSIERDAQRYTITFNRPEKHNAYSEALKDALCDALQVPVTDDTITEVVIRGRGKSFCAGGDLSEFGAVTDAGVAHASRRTRGAAPLIAALSRRIRVEVHGACIGAGIELPAFAGNIVATGDAFFQLPEVAMGLIPGAGGTVSITKRIGKSRTAYMALTNRRIDAATALTWGLIDQLED
jgi:1,4-dihydroxy-2-naphthoyl-CoA synthase